MADRITSSLASKYKIESNNCWTWLGSSNNAGYGQLTCGGKHWLAHVFLYVQAGKKIAPGLVLDHLCKNKLCVNPVHLEPVTPRINLERGKRPSFYKITQEIANQIRQENKEGKSRCYLVRKYGLAPSTISHIILENRWVNG